MNKWLYERCRNNHPCPKGLNNGMPLQIHKKTWHCEAQYKHFKKQEDLNPHHYADGNKKRFLPNSKKKMSNIF